MEKQTPRRPSQKLVRVLVRGMDHILITGATSGLGREMALQLASLHGAHIHALGRRGERLEELRADIETLGGQMTPHALDITDAAAMAQLLAGLETLDGLILNAGITSAKAFIEADATTDRAILDTNVAANLSLIRLALPALTRAKGRIQIIASLGGLVPLPYQATYAGSKAFMVNFGLSLREELKSEGVKVSIFAPGGIATEMTDIAAMDNVRNKLAPVETVAAQAFKAYVKMPALCVPGAENKLVAGLSKFLPRSFLATQAGKLYRR